MSDFPNNIRQRAKETAKDLIDEACDFKTAFGLNTYDSWQACLNCLDDLDLYDLASTEADSWDVVMYTSKALALISNTWGSDLDRAEESMTDCGFTFESFGQTCTLLAYWIVFHAVQEALEDYVEEMREMVAGLQEGAI